MPLLVDWGGERLELTSDRAVTWPRERTVIVADMHLGKAASFRAAGVPVPAGTTDAMLARLTMRLDAARATRLVILGDFLHAKTGRTDEVDAAMRRWRDATSSIEIILVRGNHDERAGDPPDAWRISCVDEPCADGPFALCHDPETPAPDGRPVLAGHVHPVVRLRDIDRTSVRAACFVFGPRRAILPAFGPFTGGHRLTLAEDDRVFAVGPDDVVEVTGPAVVRGGRG